MSTTLFHLQGCFVTNTEGIPTIYLSIVDEALITRPTDTPANTSFRPRILNPEEFSFKRRPSFWPWDDSGGTEFAAVGQLQIDNYDGKFDFLMLADVRDATTVMQMPPAGMLAASNTVSTAPVVGTCVLDNATSSEDDVITVTFKDTLARLDRPLLVRFNPPYVDSSAANRMVPLTFGACHNVKPQLLIEATRTYQLHDTTMGNIAAVRDKGQVLDVNSSPPKVVPALNRSGIQLQTLPDGMLLVDCSSIGQQVIPPGVTDVLAKVGLLRSTTNPGVDGPGVTTWTPPSAPSGWTYSSLTFGTFTRLAAANGYTQDWVMQIDTKNIYQPPPLGSFTGCYAFITTPFLQPGEHYRIRFVLDRLWRPNASDLGGFMVRTDLTMNPSGDVSGPALGPYLSAPSNEQNYLCDYACPADGTVRTLYMIMVGGGASLPNFTGIWHGLTVEKLGQFAELPVVGITYADYFYEILFNRAYEPTSTWNAADLLAIDTATGYKFGIHFDDPPNIFHDCLLPPLQSAGAAPFSDALGALRARRLVDPKLGTPVASFDLTDTDRPISIEIDEANNLTTLFGGPRNWSVSGPEDFVSDYIGVPADIRARYSRTSQYEVTSSLIPAGQYANAVGAPIFDMLLDNIDDIRAEGERVVSIYSPQIYSDGTVSSGKRRFIEFTVHFEEIGLAVGTATTIAAQNLLIGDIVSLTYPEHGFNNTPVFVAGTELFPFAQKLTIRGFL